MSQNTDGKETIKIEFMYIDLDSCTRCKGTGKNLRDAIDEVSGIMEATGREVNLEEIHVQTEDQARKLGFVTSPTIRVNGQDIQLDVKETPCDSCGDICGEDIDCRVWTYKGKEYTEAPKAMIMDAILQEIYGGLEQKEGYQAAEEVPDNLKKFFATENKDSDGSGSCCCAPPSSGSDKCC